MNAWLRRPWRVWVLFGLAALLAIGGLSVLTLRLTEMDRTNRNTIAQQQHSRAVALALWRMEGEAAAILSDLTAYDAVEIARDAASKHQTASDQALAAGDDFGGGGFDGGFGGGFGDGLSSFRTATEPTDEWLEDSQAILNMGCVSGPVTWAADQALPDNAYGGFNRAQGENALVQNAWVNPENTTNLSRRGGGDDETQRANVYYNSQIATLNGAELVGGVTVLPPSASRTDTPEEITASVNHMLDDATTASMRLGVFEFIRVDGELFVARPGEEVGQWRGYRLIEPVITEALLATAQDLLPRATLAPVQEASDAPAELQLATIPVALRPGPVPAAAASDSTLRPTIAVAWSALMGMLLVMGLALGSILRLSQRRAAFVAAVTHEMRTPLTTFRMYTEMLDQGMVPPDQQPAYITTLRGEANRLNRLIENVLTFARLERRGANTNTPSSTEPHARPLGEILPPILDHLKERARQDNFEVTFDMDDHVAPIAIAAQPETIEQILLNLVDNACKYAKPTPGQSDQAAKITLSAQRSDAKGREPKSIIVSVRDFGPGIAKGERRRLFRAFHRGDHQDHDASPGIGLGLSLSRRLARDLGGDLSHYQAQPGSVFQLHLPLAADR